MDKDFLLRHMTERFRSLYEQVLDAIASSSSARRDILIEVAFHDALLELMRHGLQSAAELDDVSAGGVDQANQGAQESGTDGPRSAA